MIHLVISITEKAHSFTHSFLGLKLVLSRQGAFSSDLSNFIFSINYQHQYHLSCTLISFFYLDQLVRDSSEIFAPPSILKLSCCSRTSQASLGKNSDTANKFSRMSPNSSL